MTTSNSLPFFRLPRLQFSLAALLLMLTVAAVGFGTWWRMPWQIDHLPEELTGRRPTVNAKWRLYCGTGIDYAALWVESVPSDLRDRPEAFNAEKPVYAMTGKCWVRRDWQKPWVLDGPVEVFDADGNRVIQAHYSSGQLHGDFCCWFTDGKIRETGKYWHGQKDGVWEERRFMSGTVETHSEYVRGQKCGVWNISGIREFYEGGKIVRQEWPGEKTERVAEFDEQERLKQETYWQNQRTERVGIDRFRAGEYRNRVRHGDWERVCTFDDKQDAAKFLQRGNWTDDLPSGDWVYELPGREPRRLQFRAGVLEMIDGQPASDLLMQKYSLIGDGSELAAILRMPDDRYFPNQDRATVLKDVLGYGPILHRDHRLPGSLERLQQYFAEQLTGDFNYSQLSGGACICLLLHEAGLAIDLRHHSLWLTTPQLATEWRDETNTAPWFACIVNAKPLTFTNADGKVEDDGMDSDLMRMTLFDSDWEEAWKNRQVIEFRQPLRCAQGVARRIDPNFDRSQRAVELLDRGVDIYELRDLDQFIAYECELHRCRLKLRGETLVFEPRPVD